MVKVLLLLASEDLLESSHSVAASLISKYGIEDVTVRSALVPLDRLLNDSDVSLWAVLQSASSNLSTAAWEQESSCPVMTITLDDPDTAALQIAKVCSLSSTDVRQSVLQAMREGRQKRLVDDAQLRTKSPKYASAIAKSFDEMLQVTGDKISAENLPERLTGKVRDRYVGATKLALVTTDRQSGFDRQLAVVPFKGAVLNMTSKFWFDQTEHIIPNHLLDVPHPNVSIVKKCTPFAIEFVVR